MEKQQFLRLLEAIKKTPIGVTVEAEAFGSEEHVLEPHVRPFNLYIDLAASYIQDVIGGYFVSSNVDVCELVVQDAQGIEIETTPEQYQILITLLNKHIEIN